MMNSYLYIFHLLRRLLETLDSVNLIVLKQIEKYLFRIKLLLLVLKHRSGHLTIKAKCLLYLSEIHLEHVIQKTPLFFWSVLLRERLLHL